MTKCFVWAPFCLILSACLSNPPSEESLLNIAGGRFVTEDDPIRDFSVRLAWNRGPGPSNCSGSLVSRTHVLTAAHCVPTNSFFDDSTVTVLMRDISDVVRSHQIIKPENLSGVEGDYALIRLNRPVPDSQTPVAIVRPDAALVPSRYVQADDGQVQVSQYGQRLAVAGYGRGSGGRLKIGEFYFLDRVNVGRTLILGRYPGVTLCSGDSGAPVLAKSSSGTYVQVGIAVSVSGQGECDANNPDMARFIDLRMIPDWLQDHAGVEFSPIVAEPFDG